MKESRVWFYEKHLRRYEKSSFKHSIVFEDFNRNGVGNEESLGGDNNVEEEE